ncbi:MAG: DNA repair protein [Gammaproteobacteria bacterium]|nr:MAG: DNA repair protein [Gammaproteobacteria bacterium]
MQTNIQLSRFFAILVIFIGLTACQSAYYSAMEKVGVHKRDIMLSRVDDAKESQQQAQQQFKSALDQLSQLINFEGGDLEEQYELINDQYQASKNAADDVSTRIAKIEDVATALFDEWQDEIGQYSSEKLKRQSQSKLKQTERRYHKLIKVMVKAESKMAPVLAALKDNSLYLKHNLNAQAIGALQGEYQSIKKDVEVLVKEMNSAIAQSQQFIDLLKP